MKRIYSEEDVTWSSIEKYIDYDSVRWSTDKNGIPVYIFVDKEGRKIDVDVNKCLESNEYY